MLFEGFDVPALGRPANVLIAAVNHINQDTAMPALSKRSQHHPKNARMASDHALAW